MAQLRLGAITLVVGSFDGYTEGIPLAEILGKDAAYAGARHLLM